MMDTETSRLVSYALEGLGRCWMPELGRYSHRFRFDVPGPANESIPESDAFYTLNVLLGMSQLSELGRHSHAEISRIYRGCCREAGNPRMRTYAYGMALWAGAKLDVAPPSEIVDRIIAILANPPTLNMLTAQDVGMVISGVTAMAAREDGRWRRAADQLAAHLRDRLYHPGSQLFYDTGKGYRRNFSSFASQVYSMLALYQFGEAFGADWAIALANAAAAKVISLQGPRGEWAWFYYVPGGRVVDFYEIYSVHQHGMAPAFLHHAVLHRVPGAREALIRGFLWLFGENEMNASMLRPKERLFYRSQLRESELDTTGPRTRRSIVNAMMGRSDSVSNHRGLVLRKECRSYELGWILWSFGGRQDYAELTERQEFRV
jgi:hypothetical protein